MMLGRNAQATPRMDCCTMVTARRVIYHHSRKHAVIDMQLGRGISMASRALATVAALAVTTLFTTDALACRTNSPQCYGKAQFVNDQYLVSCFTIFYSWGGYSDFCLNPGHASKFLVRYGDTYCARFRSLPPKGHCFRMPIFVYSPH